MPLVLSASRVYVVQRSAVIRETKYMADPSLTFDHESGRLVFDVLHIPLRLGRCCFREPLDSKEEQTLHRSVQGCHSDVHDCRGS